MNKLIALLLLAALSGPVAASFACGLPPMPPLGCKVGPCVCDENGDNCHYVFVCG